MKTQDYLKQITRFERMIERKRDEIDRLDIMICGIPANEMNPDKVQTSLSGDKMGSSVARLVDAEKEVDGLLKIYLEQRKFIIGQIDAMPNENSYMVLTDKYVRGMTFQEIAFNLKYSEKQIRRMHNKAIQEFEDLYGECYRTNPTLFI